MTHCKFEHIDCIKFWRRGNFVNLSTDKNMRQEKNIKKIKIDKIEKVYTKNGVCIEFNPADIPRIQNRKPRTISGSNEEDQKDDFTVKESEFDKMSMIIGYNASDITYGQGSYTSG